MSNAIQKLFSRLNCDRVTLFHQHPAFHSMRMLQASNTMRFQWISAPQYEYGFVCMCGMEYNTHFATDSFHRCHTLFWLFIWSSAFHCLVYTFAFNGMPFQLSWEMCLHVNARQCTMHIIQLFTKMNSFFILIFLEIWIVLNPVRVQFSLGRWYFFFLISEMVLENWYIDNESSA